MYGGKDPRTLPMYSFPDAARATGIPPSTLRSWVAGQRYRTRDRWTRFHPVIERPDENDSRLSFLNLIEAHVLRALRQTHGVPLEQVRQAVTMAEEDLGIERLLVDPRLKTSAGTLFLDFYTGLLELTPSRQFAIRVTLERYLERVEYDETGLPSLFFPFEHLPEPTTERAISISPFISFGKAVVQRRGISTRSIANRLDAGEAKEFVLEDYELTEAELEEAVLFESAV